MTTPKIIFLVLAAIVAILGAIYLAGVILLLAMHMSPLKATIWTWQQYFSFYRDNATVWNALKLSASLSGFICISGIALLIFKAMQTTRSLHGDARFATAGEIAKSGLLGSANGIIVGKYKGRILHFSGQQFVMIAAPTRSGKGVGIVVPNLLNWPDSVVVLDIKQENFDLTSGFRGKHGQDCYLFNPFAEDMRSHRYNPLTYVRDGHFRIGDLNAIAEVLYPAGGRDSFWEDQAKNLFLALGLYLFETPKLPKTLGELLRQSSGKGQPAHAYFQSIINDRNYQIAGTDAKGKPILEPKQWTPESSGLPPLSGHCVDAFNRFLSASDNTRSSILSTFNAPLGIWANPIVDAATSESDFDLREVRKRRMSIYVGITPNYLNEARRIVNLLFSQLINLNTRELPQDNPELKYQCLVLMDEFTAIGRVGIIAQAISYMAGYNMRLLTIIQSPAQLQAEIPIGYGHEGAQTIQTQHALRILFAPREQADAKEYSEMLGDETVKARSTSRQRGATGSASESISDHRRALLLPQEIKEIGEHKEIITLENCKPILCDKIKYYQDKAFTSRLLEPQPVPTLNLALHTAKIERRIRDATLDDIPPTITVKATTLDNPPPPHQTENYKLVLSKLVSRFDEIKPPTPTSTPEEADKFVKDILGEMFD